ncbi:MAG: hypothetical protein Q8916_03995 [Bacteroidota bacterium]|nr:hypothetical protein [Bacteroidota bacterium]MDP4229550.1 hypothetical protein [Bacteroidota bacterium]MDP4235113.1 hypothetical protein [Bacteroidota bacterium]
MKTPNLFLKIATISLFVFLIAGFVAYRSGVFGEFLSANTIATARPSMMSLGSSPSDSLKQTVKKADSTATSKPNLPGIPESGVIHGMERNMTSSKSGVVFSTKDIEALKKGDTIIISGKKQVVDSAKIRN